MKKKTKSTLFASLILILILLPLFQILFNIIPSNWIEEANKIRIFPKYYDEVTDFNFQTSSIKAEDKLDPYIEKLINTENLEDSIPLIIYLNYQPGEKIALKLKYEKKIHENDNYYNRLYELTKKEIQESQNNLVRKILKLNGTIKHKFSIINAISIDLPLKYIEFLVKDHNISKIAYDYVLKANLQYSFPSMNPANSWNISQYNGSNIIVAVCDSGINESHPALSGVVIDGYNTYTGGRTAIDDNFHGTYVAGIIASRDQISHGVAPNVSLINVKVFDNTGTGPSSNLMVGVEWACTKASKKPDIINFSGGTAQATLFDGMSTLTIFVDAITSIYDVLWINAAGNQGPAQLIELPADAYNSISVGELEDPVPRDTVRSDDSIVTSSSRGPTLDGRIKPDISALGYKINSCHYQTGGWRNDRTGTSFSAPHITGAAADIYNYLNQNINIAKSYYPLVTKALLLCTADDWGAPGPDSSYGYGYVNLANTWNLLQGGVVIETNTLSYDHIKYKTPFYYNLTLIKDEIFNLTLVWNRHAFYAGGLIFIYGSGRPNDLNLYLLDSNKTLVNSSMDPINNIEQISYKAAETGTYYLKLISENSQYFAGEPYVLISSHNLSKLNPSGPHIVYYTLSPELDVDLDYIFFKSFDTYEKISFYMVALDDDGIIGGTFNIPYIRTMFLPPIDIYWPIFQIFPNILYFEAILDNLFIEQGLNRFFKGFIDGSIWATFTIYDAHPIAPSSSTFYCILDYHGFIWNLSIYSITLLVILIIIDYIREERAKKIAFDKYY